jgi:tetratricopeptide (TPR) repeat protein
VLSRAAATLGLLVAATAGAEAVPRPTGLVPLTQLTSGASDQFFGQLHPDGRTLIFASNRNGTVELFRQELGAGAPELLFDEQADVSQPRISPDGRRLLYLSYRSDAFGDACVLELSSRARRCLGREGAVLHAFWFPDSRHVGLVTRAELGGPHRVVKLRHDDTRGQGELLFEGYVSSPVMSPGGRWLLAVPLAPATDGGVATLLRASRGLLVIPLGGGEPLIFQPELPGASAYPSFSRDGDFLYFAQFTDDSNADGVTDGNDNGVLVRVPWKETGSDPADGAEVRVLTSLRNNCQYPMPAADRLIATCVRRGVLQLVALPLEGQVPLSYSADRLDAEASAARHRWERLLLQERRLEVEKVPEVRVRLERRLAMAHIELGTYDSAEFDLQLMTRDAGTDEAEVSWAAVATELVQHRRDEARLGFAKLSDDFIRREKERVVRLEAREGVAVPSVRRLARVIRAEVLRTLGRKVDSLALFESLDVEAETDPDVLLLWGRLAERLFREYDDRERWARTMLRLANHPALEPRERLLHARRFVDVLTRGRAPAERLRALERARPLVKPGTEAELLLDVEVALDSVDRARQREALPRLDALWRRAPDFESHRAVAMTIVERAAHDDLELVLDEYGRRWLDEVPEGHAERKYAEALYAEVLLEHAYVELRRGAFQVAADLFLGIATRTRSLEALSGFVEASLRGGSTVQAVTERLAAAMPGPQATPLRAYGEALSVSRGLPTLDDAAFRQALSRARALAVPAAAALPRAPELQHLLGYLAHEEFHRFDTRSAALEAHGRYHLALDLAPDVYRRRASLLLELGLLQAALGNHRIALRHFEERARLPFVKPTEALAFRLARARSLFHAQELEAAAREAERGLELVELHEELRPFRALALERAMFCELAAGRYDEAARHAEALLPLLPQSTAAQVKARLALGWALLRGGRAAAAVDVLAAARQVLDSPLPLHTTDALNAHGPTHLPADELRALVEGLDAEARGAAGDGAGRLAALERRSQLLKDKQAVTPREETAGALARLATQRARAAASLSLWDRARSALDEALRLDEAWRAQTRAQHPPQSTALLTLCAEVDLAQPGTCPLARPRLVTALESALAAARTRRDADGRALRFELPLLLARLASEPPGDAHRR